MAETLTLPTERTRSKERNPRILLLYSQPKAGKTTILAGLENNLIVDMDPLGGTDFVECLSEPAKDLTKLRQIAAALAKAPGQYDYITLDPLTDLERMILPLACSYHQRTADGADWSPINPETGEAEYWRVMGLPYGAGYGHLRNAFMNTVGRFAALAQEGDSKLILSAHVKDAYITKDNKEVRSADVNLTGQLKSILCGWVDAIAYFKRDGGEGYLNFKASDNVLCGNRISHLSDKEILISKRLEDGTIETYWENIFVP